jgi:hypothetical protein
MAVQRPADEVLGLTFAVGIGGLDEVDTGIDRLAQDAFGGGIIDAWAEVVGPQSDDGDLETRMAQPAILHPCLLRISP